MMFPRRRGNFVSDTAIHLKQYVSMFFGQAMAVTVGPFAKVLCSYLASTSAFYVLSFLTDLQIGPNIRFNTEVG